MTRRERSGGNRQEGLYAAAGEPRRPPATPIAYLLQIEDSTGFVMYVKRLDPQHDLTVAFQPAEAARFPLREPAPLAQVEQVVKTWPGAGRRVSYVPEDV